jgi:hypothetical protein
MGRKDRNENSDSNKVGKKATLPEILDCAALDCTDPNVVAMTDAHRIVMLLEEAAKLKDVLDDKVPDDQYDPNYHLARRYKDIKEELAELQADCGMEGLRHNRFVFVARLQDGRKTVDMERLGLALAERGVHIDVVMDAIKAATKYGESYWVKEVKVLEEK